MCNAINNNINALLLVLPAPCLPPMSCPQKVLYSTNAIKWSITEFFGFSRKKNKQNKQNKYILRENMRRNICVFDTFDINLQTNIQSQSRLQTDSRLGTSSSARAAAAAANSKTHHVLSTFSAWQCLYADESLPILTAIASNGYKLHETDFFFRFLPKE